MTEEVQTPAPTPPQDDRPVLKQSTVVGAGLGAAWGILGGPPGIIGGALVGGVIGHFWGAKIVKNLKKVLDDVE